jgi:hypothetical protein
MQKVKIYLDDVRIPLEKEWIVVKNYDEFVEKINEIGFENIDIVSLDHDLGDTAMQEYYNNVSPNYKLDYDNIKEKTGYDCAKWLVENWLDGKPVFEVVVHSANPIGSSNITGYINNYFMNIGVRQSCVRVRIPHIVS